MENLKMYNSSYTKKIIKRVCLTTASFMVVTMLVTGCGKEETKEESFEKYNKSYVSIEVEEGDTLYSIAQDEMNENVYDSIDDYIEEIKEINRLRSDTIREGQYIIVPIVSKKEENVSTEEKEKVVISYCVEAGDTLGYIASSFGDSIDAICKRNSIREDALLNEGTFLSISTTMEKKQMYEFEKSKREENSIKYR